MPTKLYILDDNQSQVDYIPVIQASHADNTSNNNLRYAKEQFQQLYQQHPHYVARAPGRVNIIGEHIDYNGFGVLPMALEQSVFVSCSSAKQEQTQKDEPTITLDIQSTSPGAQPRQYTYNTTAMSPSTTTPPFDSTERDWSHYVLCAFFGVLEELMSIHKDWQPPVNQRFSLLIHGTVPQGAGVSSSSALVVSSALAFLALFNQLHSVPRASIAQLCARCERHVGTEGGGMDQAISIFAQANSARYIQFQPTFQHQAIPMIQSCSWVVCHSLEESHKRQDAATLFNKRVVECKIAGWWLGKLLVHSKQYPVSIWELVLQSDKSLEELEALAQTEIPLECSKTELLTWILGDMPINDTTLQAVASKLGITRLAGIQVLEVAENFCIRNRLVHVLSETRRVQEFVALCRGESSEINAEALGKLMNQSHESCSKLYDCSSARVDCLQRICVEAPGAVGSRMTGAGWGGCVISLVYTQHVDTFCQHVSVRYYSTLSPKDLGGKREEEYMFVTKASQGSHLFDYASK